MKFMSRYTCKDCLYWKQKLNNKEIGECRFNPPAISVTISNVTRNPERFPVTYGAEDYCGKFQINDSKGVI